MDDSATTNPRHDLEPRSRLESYARRQGYELACGPVEVVTRVAGELRERSQRGELSSEFTEQEMGWFSWPQEDLLPQPRSIAVLAIPRPAHTVSFELKGRALEVLLPPTYVCYRATNQEVTNQVSQVMRDTGAHFQLLRAPLKAIGSRLGLVRYGRNNITYHGAMGSGLQLVGLVTDADLGESANDVREAQMLEACESCDACRSACPTGAIDEERFLLWAERCLTFVNEHPGAWPAWLPSSAHNSLLGCMLCQEACPENIGRLCRETSGASLNEGETRWLLDGCIDNTDPNATSAREKVARLGLTEYIVFLGRNLRALLDS